MIPWWAKLAAKLFLSRLPFGYSVWRKLGLFRHGSMDSAEYALRVFEERAEQAGVLNRLQGKRILELGPGDGIGSAMIAASIGAEAVLVDAGSFARDDVDFYVALANTLQKKRFTPPDISHCNTIDDILRACKSQYMTAGLASLRIIPDHSIDYIFSQAVLEHVRKHELLATLQELRRILKPGGVCSHQVDLRDHLGGALNNMRFSSKVWESHYFASSGFYTNRICFTHMLEMFSQAGFQATVMDAKRWPQLPTLRNKLASEFRSLSDDDLMTSQFDVVLR
jgi:ubiquinone/menaquinone biosynthesis C-methylase UbiE